MNTQPKLLDLFCCAGGAAVGYHRAGFTPYGVDINPQPNYPYAFHQGDVLAVMNVLNSGGFIDFNHPDGSTEWLSLLDFVLGHASPPCQAFSKTKTLHNNTHPDLVEPTRAALIESGLPYIIENVVGAPLLDPLVLCGTEFGLQAPDVDGVTLKVIRHRLFESNMILTRAGVCDHNPKILTASIYGAGGGWTPEHRDSDTRRGGYVPHTDVCRALLGVDWTTKHELSQVVPPAFTEHLGLQIIGQLSTAKAA